MVFLDLESIFLESHKGRQENLKTCLQISERLVYSREIEIQILGRINCKAKRRLRLLLKQLTSRLTFRLCNERLKLV